MKNTRIITITILACLVLIVLASVIGVLNSKKRLNLYNIDQVESSLSSDEIRQLEDYIWESMQRNFELTEDRDEVIALVRPSSFTEKTEDNVRSYDFLIDIDEFKATYKVSFAFLGKDGFYEAPVVDCPEPELMKYKETVCSGEKTSMMSVTIGQYLPHYYTLDDGRFVTVMRDVNDVGEEIVNVRVSSCGDQGVIAEVQESVNNWIREIGYNPQDYKIVIPELCDGAGDK